MKNIQQLSCFWQIVFREIVVLGKVYKSKIIDILILLATNVIVFTYLMPHFGMSINYGLFVFIGNLSLIAFFEVIPRTSVFVADITGPKKISYLLTLPISSGMAFLAIGVGWACVTALLTSLILPIGKLFLLSKLDLSLVSWWRFIAIFITSNLFFGIFALWLCGLIKEMKYMGWIWSRVVNPMFMLGCYFYPWKTMYQAASWAGRIALINPLIYSLEGLRAAVLGQEGSLPFYLCVMALWGFILFFATHAIYLLKKRLDCV